MGFRSLVAALTAAAGCAAAQGQVIISEILANEFGTDVPGEWCEIYNPSAAPVDISGWRLADEDGGSPSGPFPEGFIIQPFEAVVIIADGTEENNPAVPIITAADFYASWGETNAAGQPYRVIVQSDYITLANTGSATNEVLTLIDANGVLVDEANYENGTNGWPLTPNGGSVVLGSIFLDSIANDFGCAWSAALNGVDGAVVSREVFVVAGNGSSVLALAGENVASPGFVAEAGGFVDCNGNGLNDPLDICNEFSADCNGNGVPDECEADCDGNGVPDDCDYAADFSIDCNLNGVLDSCEIASDGSLDANGNGDLDVCEGQRGLAIITEIMFDPFTGSEEMEYVEILNTSGAALDVSGWYLQDIELSGERTDPIPAGTVLSPGGIAVLTRSVTGDVEETRQDYIDAWGSQTPAGDPILWIPLENWGARATFGTPVTEVLTIVSDDGVAVDIVNYINRTSNSEPLPGGWPGGDNHGSYFLDGTKLNAADNDAGPNWRLSIEGLSGVIRSNEFDPADLPTWTAAGNSGEDYGTPGFIFAGAPEAPSGAVMITEIMAAAGSVFPGEDPANPLAAAGLDEWVEIYNTTGSPIDISGWYLQDEDGRTSGLPAGSVLAAGEVAVIVGDDFPVENPDPVGAFYDAWGCGYQVFSVNEWYTSNGRFGLSRLSDGPNFVNEILRVVSASGVPSDLVNYDDDGFVWPVDGTGVATDANWSIYVFDPAAYNAADNDSGLVWADSLALLDGARTSADNEIYNAPGDNFGSPGHLEGVQTPDLGDCPTPACNAADVAAEFGVLNVNDIVEFANGFNAMLPVADVSPIPGGDGVFNVNDVIDFVNTFNAGCP